MGARSGPAMEEWIKKQLEADSSFAAVPELAAIGAKLTQGKLQAEEAVTAIKEAAAKLDETVKENAELYIKFAEKVVAKGLGYIEKELTRLQKISSGGKMSAAKLLEVSRKISVLESFAAPSDAPTGTEEAEAVASGEVKAEEKVEEVAIEEKIVEKAEETAPTTTEEKSEDEKAAKPGNLVVHDDGSFDIDVPPEGIEIDAADLGFDLSGLEVAPEGDDSEDPYVDVE